MAIPRIPPPVLAAAAASVQWRMTRGRSVSPLSSVAAAGTALVSLWFDAGAIRAFRSRRTTLNPVVPGASVLVTDGPNAITRNPMYVGGAGLLLAHAIARRSLPALVPAAAFVLAIDRFQIRAEEAVLRERFGAEYDAYRAEVPRWLGRRSFGSSDPG